MTINYTRSDRWRIWLALVAAIFLHLAALGLARTKVSDDTYVEFKPSDITGVEFAESDLPILLPPELPLPDPPVLPDQAFIEEQSTPPRPRQRIERIARPPAPINTGNASRPATIGGAKAFAIIAPRPEYPYEARRRQLTGSGVVILHVSPVTGEVTEVEMEESTGSPILDRATISAFQRWRFRPGVAERVRTPITYQLNGASF